MMKALALQTSRPSSSTVVDGVMREAGGRRSSNSRTTKRGAHRPAPARSSAVNGKSQAVADTTPCNRDRSPPVRRSTEDLRGEHGGPVFHRRPARMAFSHLASTGGTMMTHCSGTSPVRLHHHISLPVPQLTWAWVVLCIGSGAPAERVMRYTPASRFWSRIFGLISPSECDGIPMEFQSAQLGGLLKYGGASLGRRWRWEDVRVLSRKRLHRCTHLGRERLGPRLHSWPAGVAVGVGFRHFILGPTRSCSIPWVTKSKRRMLGMLVSAHTCSMRGRGQFAHINRRSGNGVVRCRRIGRFTRGAPPSDAGSTLPARRDVDG